MSPEADKTKNGLRCSQTVACGVTQDATHDVCDITCGSDVAVRHGLALTAMQSGCQCAR